RRSRRAARPPADDRSGRRCADPLPGCGMGAGPPRRGAARPGSRGPGWAGRFRGPIRGRRHGPQRAAGGAYRVAAGAAGHRSGVTQPQHCTTAAHRARPRCTAAGAGALVVAPAGPARAARDSRRACTGGPVRKVGRFRGAARRARGGRGHSAPRHRTCRSHRPARPGHERAARGAGRGVSRVAARRDSAGPPRARRDAARSRLRRRRRRRRASSRRSRGADRMTFVTPWILLLLPALAAWWWWRRRHRRPAAPYSDVSLAAEASRERWWVRLPPMLRTVALAALIIAAAGPRIGGSEVETKREGIAIAVAID